MVLLRKLLHLGIYVRCFFKASWSYQKLVSGGSPGGPGGSKNRSWKCPGVPRRRPRGSRSGFGEGKGAQEHPRGILERSWTRNGNTKEVEVSHLGRLFRSLRRLWRVLVGLFWAILLRIGFLSIFYRFWNDFGMIFGTNLEAKKRRNWCRNCSKSKPRLKRRVCKHINFSYVKLIFSFVSPLIGPKTVAGTLDLRALSGYRCKARSQRILFRRLYLWHRVPSPYGFARDISAGLKVTVPWS